MPLSNVVNMLHMPSYIHQGGGGGILTFLTSTSLTLGNTLPLLTCCTCCIYYIYIFIHIIIYIIRGVRGCISVVGVCGHCVAKSTRALKLREEEKMDGWMFAWDDWKSWMFFKNPWRAKSIHCAGQTQILTLEPHACQSKWMSILQTFFDKSHRYQHFVSWPKKSQF